MPDMAFDFSGLESMLDGMKRVQKEHDRFLRDFLLKQAMQTLEATKMITPVDTGNLVGRWELSSVFRSGNSLWIVLFNPATYASFVEEGHMQRRRFVPGEWDNGKFRYNREAEGGMMLTDRWVPGFHMARISLAKLERVLPRRYEQAFKDFLFRMGVG